MKVYPYDVGDSICKIVGDYQFNGVVRGVIEKSSGELRYAVEDSNGMIHIFSDKQIAPAPIPEDELPITPLTMRKLKDPISVHVNMLYGRIAKPSFLNMLHIYGITDILLKLDMCIEAIEAGSTTAPVLEALKSIRDDITKEKNNGPGAG